MIEALLDRQRGLTPALARLSPQVSGLASQEESAVDAVKALTNALLFTAHQFNVVRNMAELQMGILADELLERYWFWRFDEFLYVLREGIAQTWGKTYDRLDPPTVHEWCRAYQELRDMQVEHEATRQAQDYKKAEGKLSVSPLASEPGYAPIRAKIDAMSDAELMRGGSYYASLDQPTPEEALKLAVATEVWQERWAAQQLAEIAANLPGHNLPSARELVAMEKAADEQLEYNMATGAYEAAGFKDFAGLQKLLAADTPTAPTWNQAFAK